MVRICIIISIACVQHTASTSGQTVDEGARASPREGSDASERRDATSAFLSAAETSENTEKVYEAIAKMMAKRKRAHTVDEWEEEHQYREARQRPYSVLLNMSTETVSASGFRLTDIAICTGSLIALDWVLTAAHCFRYVPITAVLSVDVFAGVNFVDVAEPLPSVLPADLQVRRSSEWHVHPDYDCELSRADPTFDYDLALVKLSEPFEATDFVNTVALSTAPWAGGYRTCVATEFELVETDRTEAYVRRSHSLEAGRPCACEPILEASKGAAASRYICTALRPEFDPCEGGWGGGLVCGGRVFGVVSYGKNVAGVLADGTCDEEARREFFDMADLNETEIDEFLELVPLQCGDGYALQFFQDTYPSLSWIRATAGLGGAPRRTGRPVLLPAALLLAFRGFFNPIFYHGHQNFNVNWPAESLKI